MYIGDTLDLLDGVTFISSTQGDITDAVETVVVSNLQQLGVHIVSYQTHYENNELFSVDRRVIVSYPSFSVEDENNNLLTNGDFTNNFDGWSTTRNNDYPSTVDFIIDPGLKRMQVIMDTASTMLASPNLYQSNLSLDSQNTYELTLLVSGSNDTFFSIDIVELDQTNQVIQTVVDTITVNILEEDGNLQLAEFSFTPSVSSGNATLRIMFGQDDGNSPTGEIYIDNVLLKISE